MIGIIQLSEIRTLWNMELTRGGYNEMQKLHATSTFHRKNNVCNKDILTESEK